MRVPEVVPSGINEAEKLRSIDLYEPPENPDKTGTGLIASPSRTSGHNGAAPHLRQKMSKSSDRSLPRERRKSPLARKPRHCRVM